MSAVSKPRIHRHTTDPSEQYRLLAHEMHKRLTAGAGPIHQRVRRFQTELEQLVAEAHTTGTQNGRRDAQALMVVSLGDVLLRLKDLRDVMPLPDQTVAHHIAKKLTEILDGAMSALEIVQASCIEAKQIIQAEAEKLAPPPPEEEKAPSPPQGFFTYRLSVSESGHLKTTPPPTTPLKLDNCVVFSRSAWVAYEGANEHLPCWIASRTKPLPVQV